MALSSGRCAALAGGLIVLAGTSANAETDTQLQVWNSVTVTGDLAPAKDGVALWFDGHLRRGDAGTTVIVRPGIGYRLSPGWSVWAGYAWIPSFTDGGDRRDEHRIWQQAIGTLKRGALTLSLRGRLEQRMGDGDDLGHRLRTQARLAWTPSNAPVGLVVWDEVFVALNDADWGQRQGVDQNRLFAGVSAPVGGGARVEAGYLFALIDRAINVQIHALAVSLTLPLAR